MKFKRRVLEVVSKIKEGEVLTYKEVAKKAGNKNAQRAVGQILANNKNKDIPCHRVIKSNREVGGYLKRKKLAFQKAGILLKEGAIGIISTDTFFGICTSAFKKESVEKIYKLKKRNSKKPFVILISDLDDLKKFKIKITSSQKEVLRKIWPAKINVILPCPSEKFFYLHRGTKKLVFCLPKEKMILRILKISGPLVAPLANLEGKEPAKNIREAKKYFQNKVFYFNFKTPTTKPSTIIELTKNKIKIVRKGAQINKIKNLNKTLQNFIII